MGQRGKNATGGQAKPVGWHADVVWNEPTIGARDRTADGQPINPRWRAEMRASARRRGGSKRAQRRH